MRRSPSVRRRAKFATRTGRWSSRSTRSKIPAGWSQVAIDVLAQKYFRKAGVPAKLKPVREKGVPALALPPGRGRGGTRQAAGGRALRQRDQRRSRSSTGSPGPGPTGAGRAATSPPRRTPRRSSTRCASCWRSRWRRPTRRNGSIPACTGPTASTGRRRVTSSSTRRPARCTPRARPTSGRSRTPASSRASRTTSSTRAGSWICGSARRGSSSTARAPAPTSRICAARASGSPAAASPRA